jgi:NhaP-type Na+/H+ or K+/H+ antiporter
MNARTVSASRAMMPWAEAAFAKYGAIGLGLIVGTGAKYGLTLAEGRKITFRLFIIDVLLIGMVALLAATACEKLHIAGNAAAMVSALFAVSSDRVLRMIRERFLRRVDVELRTIAEEQKGVVRQEVQMEMSANAVIEDQAVGRAPDNYAALKPKG